MESKLIFEVTASPEGYELRATNESLTVNRQYAPMHYDKLVQTIGNLVEEYQPQNYTI